MNIFLLSVVLYKEAYFLNSNFFQKLLARSISNVPRYSVLLIYRVSIKKHIVDYLNFEEKNPVSKLGVPNIIIDCQYLLFYFSKLFLFIIVKHLQRKFI